LKINANVAGTQPMAGAAFSNLTIKGCRCPISEAAVVRDCDLVGVCWQRSGFVGLPRGKAIDVNSERRLSKNEDLKNEDLKQD
jgi:hypothetical protein